jgi:hypothetical protein
MSFPTEKCRCSCSKGSAPRSCAGQVFALKTVAVTTDAPLPLPLHYTFSPPASTFTQTSVQKAVSAMEPAAQMTADSPTHSSDSLLRLLTENLPFYLGKLRNYGFSIDEPDMELSIIPWSTPMISATPIKFAEALLYAKEYGGLGGYGRDLDHDAAQDLLVANRIIPVQCDLPDREGINCWIRVPLELFVTSLIEFEVEHMMANVPVFVPGEVSE